MNLQYHFYNYKRVLSVILLSFVIFLISIVNVDATTVKTIQVNNQLNPVFTFKNNLNQANARYSDQPKESLLKSSISDFTSVGPTSGTFGSCPWSIDATGTLHIGAGTLGTLNSSVGGPWYKDVDNIKKVDIAPGVICAADSSYLFCNLQKVTQISGLSNMDTSNVTDMYDMFWGCTNLTSLDLSHFDTSQVTDMSFMFDRCLKLNTLNLDGFNTENVTTMEEMFGLCSSLTSLDLSSFKSDNHSMDMIYMFTNCSNLQSLDLSNLSMFTSSGGYVSLYGSDYMFFNCPKLWKIKLNARSTINSASCLSMPTVGTKFDSNYQVVGDSTNGYWQAVGSGTDHNPQGQILKTNSELVDYLEDTTRTSNDTIVWKGKIINIAPTLTAQPTHLNYDYNMNDSSFPSIQLSGTISDDDSANVNLYYSVDYKPYAKPSASDFQNSSGSYHALTVNPALINQTHSWSSNWTGEISYESDLRTLASPKEHKLYIYAVDTGGGFDPNGTNQNVSEEAVVTVDPPKNLAPQPQGTDINDGLTNWTATTTVPQGYAAATTNDSGDTVRMGFTFGSWSSHDLLSTASSGSSLYYQRSNIFLEETKSGQSPQNIQAFYGGASSGPWRSLDFSIIEDVNSKTSRPSPNSSFLDQLQNPTLFVSKSGSDVQALKLMGYYALGDNNNNLLEVEEVLRPSIYSNSGISQELYVKNTTTVSQTFGIMNGEDTQLENKIVGISGDPDYYDPDHVPIYALGNNRGIYFQSNKHRLNVNTDVTNGPNRYSAHPFSNYLTFDKNFTGTNFDNAQGQEAYNNGLGYSAGDILLTKSGTDYPDSAYSLLWPSTKDLGAGKTKHYAVEIGMNQSSYSKPWISEQWTNTSSKDKNYVGDQLKFTVTLGNAGKDSEYQATILRGLVPEGIAVDTKSFKLATGTGSAKSVTYNTTNNEVDLSTADAIDLKDNQTAQLTFTGKIADGSAGKTLTTTPKLTATELKLNSHQQLDFEGADVNIPVAERTFVAKLTHTAQDKSRTLPPNYYVPGDQIDFYMDYVINKDSSDSVSVLNFTTKCSPGLTFDDHAVASDGIDNDLQTTYQTDHTTANWPTTVTVKKRDGTSFKAGDHVRLTITGTAGNSPDGKHSSSYKSVSHTADVSGTLNSGNTIASAPQKVTVTRQNFAYFVEVPNTIDFGTAITTGKPITNLTTDGSLKINSYCTDNSFDVRVAYDNTGDDRLLNGTSGVTVATDNTLLLYGSHPVLSNGGTTVATIDSSSGSNTNSHGKYDRLTDLTTSVGKDKWTLNTPHHAVPGSYKGKMTWSMVNSLSN